MADQVSEQLASNINHLASAGRPTYTNSQGHEETCGAGTSLNAGARRGDQRIGKAVSLDGLSGRQNKQQLDAGAGEAAVLQGGHPHLLPVARVNDRGGQAEDGVESRTGRRIDRVKDWRAAGPTV